MTLTLRHIILALILLFPVILSSCFTGVESTPKISTRDIRKSGAARVTPEMTFLNDITPLPPANWPLGRGLYVTDNRLSLAMTPYGSAPLGAVDSLAGTIISFAGVAPVTTITGDEGLRILFTTERGDTLSFRPGFAFEDLPARSRLDIPFTVDLDLVARVGERLAHKEYYVLPSRRYLSDGSETSGLRYQKARITRVEPGNDLQPLRVFFIASDTPDRETYVYMTLGADRTSTRNFDTLFSFDNPRSKYSSIDADIWDKIIHSQVDVGMTPNECRLALGAPNDYRRYPSTMGIVEQWSYDNGTFLFFEDGMLARYRK